MMTTTNELAEAVATALEKAEHQKSLSPTQRMSSGYEARDRALSEALAKEEHLAGRPLDRREERAVRERAEETLAFVGLAPIRHEEPVANLSYGDQRRVEIARALASNPRLLLLDEPTAGMNPQESARLTAFMERLRDERELTILLIEHDMQVIMNVSERITVLDHGEKISEGPPEQVRADERVVEAYLGKREP